MTNGYFTPTDIVAGSRARSSKVNANLDAVEAGFDLLPTEANIKEGKISYAVDTGAADAYVVSLPHAPSSYSDGLLVEFKVGAGNTNTGACTIDVDGLGAKSVKDYGGNDPVAGDMPAGAVVSLRYNSTAGEFRCVGPFPGAGELSAVTSVFGRQGAVAASSGDYDADQIDETASNKIMTAAERTKLAGIEASANAYTHPNHSGDVTSTGDGATVIANDAVTNAKLADVATATIKGRVTASTGDPEDLTAAQVRTLINVEDGATADQTGAEIKTAYEGEADTNAFTDAEQTKLSGIETLADVTDATNVNAAGAVMESDYDAQTILAATTDNTPAAVTVAESEIVGRPSGGNVGALTAAQVRTIINVADGAEVNPAAPSQANAEDGTSTTEYSWTPQRAHQAAKDAVPIPLIVAVGDEETVIGTGTAKTTFRMPYGMTLTEVRASLTTASTSGDVTVDINESGTTILSTKLTIDANEKTSTTAATAAVISDTTLADDAEITIDIDGAGTDAAGLKVTLIGYKTTT